MSTAPQSDLCRRSLAAASGSSGFRARRAANSSLCLSCLALTSDMNPGLFSGDSRELTTLTRRSAASEWPPMSSGTGCCGTGAILTAVCAALVVAPPMRRGIVQPVRLISFAACTISSSEGVMSPESPMASALLSSAAARIFSHGTMTPRSMTS